MAKETGLGWSVLDVDDSGGVAQDLKPDTTNFQFAVPRGVQDVTGVGSLGMERLLLLADFSVTLNFVFDDAGSDSVHCVFKDVPTTSVIRDTTLTVSGQTITAGCLYTDYSYNRNADGSLTGSAPGVLATGTPPAWS